MGTTYLHAVASLDGYIADERDDVGPLHDWYFNGDHPLVDEDHAAVHGAPFRVSAASADYVRGMWSRQKVLVIGRHQFDLTNGWEGHPPASNHVVPSAGLRHITNENASSTTATAECWSRPTSSRDRNSSAPTVA